MWLDKYYKCKGISGRPQFKRRFFFWLNRLFNFTNKLYTWNDLPFPQKEIETRLIIKGKCGFNKSLNELVACDISLFGITQFYDIFTSYNWTTPKNTGTCEIGKDGVLIENDSLRNPIFPIIEHYAEALAHVDITFINSCINGRAQRTSVVGSNKQAEEVRRYNNKLAEGYNDVIVDRAFLNTEFHDNDISALHTLKELYDVRQELLYSFYEDLGIKKSQQKRERLITDEVNADNGLLKLNILDMTDARTKACNEINNMFGLNVSVKCNVDFNEDGIADGKEGAENET